MTEPSQPADVSRASRFEDRVVSQIMTAFGLDADIERLRQAAARTSGTRQISLAVFQAEYPSFPVRLGTEAVAMMQGVDLTELYRRFTRTRAYAAYRAFCDRNGLDDSTQRLGLVFPWPEYIAMSIHNLQDRCAAPTERLCVAKLTRRFNSGVALTIEPFEMLLGRIRGIWQP